MSDESAKVLTDAKVDDALIAEYLAENPDFFEHHPQLLQQMRLRHSAQGAVSLVERQQQILRDRVRQLEEEITDLMVHFCDIDRVPNIHRSDGSHSDYIRRGRADPCLMMTVMACR